MLEDRDGSYPFALIALLTWLPLTVWLLRAGPARARRVWMGAAAFSISILVLLFIGRTFNNYYLVWPMTGALVAALLYASVARCFSFCCFVFFGSSAYRYERPVR